MFTSTQAFFARLAAVAVFVLAVPGQQVHAQAADRPVADGVVTGFVIDAATGSALSSAIVAIEAAGDVTVVKPAESGVFLARGATAVTDADGGYRFAGLNAGAYRLRVRHLGYREAVIDVELSLAVAFQVSVGLVVSPIRLEPMGVVATGATFGRTRSSLDEAMLGRVDAESMRQEHFLESDARVLTLSEVTEAVTLGETDLLRALQRLPGVSARDDYMAGFWTRGAPWGQTRAYYDGLPLFNPVHAFGLLSGLNPDAVGLASFHPGVRSAGIGEGAAGVLNVESRGAARPGLHGIAELSVTSARGALESESQDGSRGLVVSARRSYVDAATRLARLAGGDSAVYVPYSFLDLTARGDLRVGPRTAIMASGVWAEDDIRGSVRRLLRNTRGHWGNRIARVGAEQGVGKARARTMLGVSRFDALINPPVAVPTGDNLAVAEPAIRPVPQHGATLNGLTVLTVSADLAQSSGARRPSWAGGVQLNHYRQTFSGQYPRPYPVAVLPDTLFLFETLTVPAVWAEHRWIGAGHWALETGLRAEVPSRALHAPRLALAPRVSARYSTGRVSWSAAVGRSWQYTQALAPAGPSVGPDLYLTDVWLLSADTVPAIRADIATLGTEISLSSGWLASATAYVRRSTGVAVPDPEPGVLSRRRPIFVTAWNQARGIEVGIRRVVGRTTASLSYTLSRSMLDAGGYRYPSPADRRHVIDATAMYRATPGFRVGGAMTIGTGAPFSRFILSRPACDTLLGCGADTLVAERIELPNGSRTAAYGSIDLLLDWEGMLGRARVGAFLQVRNVLNRSNAVTYTGSLEPCSPAPPTVVEARPGTCDQFDRGVPLLPLAGVRIAF
ncbi:MAG: TonB-dependent receptor [Gemmatimonadetes bacterium]|nr:TonB-dependent receptor [Gemmatimonadota bacterium]